MTFLSWAPYRLLLPFLLVLLATVAPAKERPWVRVSTQNFELFTNTNEKVAAKAILQYEQVRSAFIKLWGGSPGNTQPVRVVLFNSIEEYKIYSINKFLGAYYFGTRDRDYIVMSDWHEDAFRVAVHEYVHLLVRASEMKLPGWLNEGVAELYSTLRPYKKGMVFGEAIPHHIST